MSSLNVIYIEDEMQVVNLVKNILKETKYHKLHFRHAVDLASGLRLLSENHPDVLLLDLHLPDSQGIATLIKVRSVDSHVPIVVFTGAKDETIAAEVIKHGAQDYLEKAELKSHKLLRCIGYAIERKAVEEELKKAREELSSLVSDKTRELEATNRRLKLEIQERISAEAALRENEAHYRLLAENINDVIWTADLDLYFHYISPSVTSLLGYTVPEMMALRRRDIFTTASMELTSQAIASALAKKGKGKDDSSAPINIELELKRKNGSTVWTDTRFGFLRDQSGNPKELLAISRDITEARENRAVLERNIDNQRALNCLLNLTLEELTSDDLLAKALDILLGISWLCIEAKGAIFLFDADNGMLVMKVHSGLADPILQKCAQVPFGTCLCGRAAATGKTVFASHVDSTHEVHYPGMADHGHYCVPILLDSQILGVVGLYLHAGYTAQGGEIEFLTAYSKALAMAIAHHRDELALRVSETRTRKYLSLLPDPLVIYDMGGHVIFVNAAFEKTFGWNTSELVNEQITFVPPEALPETKRNIKRMKQGQAIKAFETKRLTKDGRKLDVLINTATFHEAGNQAGNIVAFRDITLLKQAQEAQRREEARLESLVNISQYRSDNEEEILNLSLEEVLRLTDSKVGYIYNYHEDSREFVLNTWSKEVMKECSVVEPQTVYPLDKTGLWGEAVRQRRPIVINDFVSSNPLRKGYPTGHVALSRFCTVPVFMDGLIVAVVGVANKETDYDDADVRQLTLFMDSVWKILERQRAIIGFKESEERYRNLVETISEGLLEVDKDNRVTFCNKFLADTLGYEKDKLMGINTLDLLDEKNRALLRSQWDQRKQGKSNKYELGWSKADGHILHSLVSATPLRDSMGNFKGSLCLITDITERKTLESQLLQAQKLEAIGQLAAGIAHEINTPTQYVSDNTRFLRDSFLDLTHVIASYLRLAELVMQQQPTDPSLAQAAQEADAVFKAADGDYLIEEVPKAIEQTLEGLDRISTIVRSMKEFAHPGPDSKTATDLNRAIENTVIVAKNEWKYVAEVSTDLDPQLPSVPCVPGEVNQVLLNIIVNAAHAIADVVKEGQGAKGLITISTRKVDQYAEIRIADTGTGIPPAIRDRIFDPFFTTKAPGKGTGQGLAIAYRVIVDKHGGQLAVESEEGCGTTFIIRLPSQDSTRGGQRA
ncbi:MAG: PAS domain S-box protein [Pseudomonadota bacterium]